MNMIWYWGKKIVEKCNQAFTAYDTALTFSHASNILYDLFNKSLQTLEYKDFGLIIPFMVNCSFASELFLKALIGFPQRGHKLGELFKYLLTTDAQIANSIKDSVLKSFNNSDKPLANSFEEELASVERTFEQFRYGHEPNSVDPHSYNYLFILIFMNLLEAHAEIKFGKRPVQNDTV